MLQRLHGRQEVGGGQGAVPEAVGRSNEELSGKSPPRPAINLPTCTQAGKALIICIKAQNPKMSFELDPGCGELLLARRN